MSNLTVYLQELEQNIKFLVQKNRELQLELQEKDQHLQNNSQKLQQQVRLINTLEQENKNLKVANAISGNDEYKRLMKAQMNRMIKEIDLCIAELQIS